jgi:XapX domain-containing protein
MPILELKSLAVGIAVGLIFSRLGLPIPAPPVLAGVLGIVGIWLGYRLAMLL